LQTIREDFGTARVDHIFSEKDSAIAAYTNDDSGSVTATPLDAFSTDLISLREQVFSLEETHVLSTNVVNTARVGFSRAGLLLYRRTNSGQARRPPFQDS